MGQKGAGQPLCPLSCRVSSKWSAGSGTEGTLTPFAGVCTNTTFIPSTCGEKKFKCLEEDIGQAQGPWGKAESKGDDLPIPLPKVAQPSPITKGDTGGQTDRQPPSQPISAWEGGLLAPQSR